MNNHSDEFGDVWKHLPPAEILHRCNAGFGQRIPATDANAARIRQAVVNLLIFDLQITFTLSLDVTLLFNKQNHK
jgi:hypothetical protein